MHIVQNIQTVISIGQFNDPALTTRNIYLLPHFTQNTADVALYPLAWPRPFIKMESVVGVTPGVPE